MRFLHHTRWGYGKIEGELLKLGFQVAQTTIRNVLTRNGIEPVSSRASSVGWKYLMTHYKKQILACDFCAAPSGWALRPYLEEVCRLASYARPR